MCVCLTAIGVAGLFQNSRLRISPLNQPQPHLFDTRSNRVAQSRDFPKDQICNSSGRHRASGSGKTNSEVGPDASFSVHNLSQEKQFHTESSYFSHR